MARNHQRGRKRNIVRVAAKATLASSRCAVVAPFQKQEGAPKYARDVLNSGLRVITSETSVETAQYALPSTETTYNLISRARLRKPDIVDLGGDAKGLWIGRRDAEYVMLYFHGGGFVISATPGHVSYQFKLQKKLCKKGHSFAVFSLAYTLAPGTRYPGQLIQAATALRYLLDQRNRKPSSIILGGDSAGGNLIGALLLHLAYPHPSGLVPSIQLSTPLLGALFISPWISFDTSSPSFQSNFRSDYITVEAIDNAVQSYVGAQSKGDYYMQPIKAPVEYWVKVVSSVVTEIMLWTGSGEILFDEISAFARLIKQALAETKSSSAGSETNEQQPHHQQSHLNFIITEKASHEKMLLDTFFFMNRKKNGSGDITRWFTKILA